MQFISSDTNIWIDFNVIGCIDVPFLLRENYAFLMSGETIDAELLFPSGFRERLLDCGLIRTELNEAEFILSLQYLEKYTRISQYDAYALAIAKNRKIMLLSGDKALKKAALAESVEVHGILWVIDQLEALGCIEADDYRGIIMMLLDHCGKDVFLPEKELRERLR